MLCVIVILMCASQPSLHYRFMNRINIEKHDDPYTPLADLILMRYRIPDGFYRVSCV
jgi:hypothetical protein